MMKAMKQQKKKKDDDEDREEDEAEEVNREEQEMGWGLTHRLPLITNSYIACFKSHHADKVRAE